MDLNQSIILGTLILTLIWWTTEIVNRTYASIFLLTSFILLGKMPLKIVLKFPLSSNFYVVALSFLLSQGIVNSNVANRLANSILGKYGNNPYRLIFMSFIFSIILIFLIPQAFPRAILLASIYREFFRDENLPKMTKEVLFFSIFMAISTTYMAFLNGDLILNHSVIQLANISISWLEWAKYMMVPTILTIIAIFITLILTFKKDLKDIVFDFSNEEDKKPNANSKEKLSMIIMGLVILLWMTEPLHSINPASNIYLFVLVLTVMFLHMLLGSSVTTASVVIPILIELTKGIIDPIIVSLLVYLAVNMHFILPFHHTVIMVGSGNDLYSNKVVIKYGLVLTILLFLIIFVLYIPWWKFMNLL